MSKQQQKPFPVRMKPEIHAWLAALAQANNRSMNGQINEIFLQAMKQLEKAAKRVKQSDTEAQDFSVNIARKQF